MTRETRDGTDIADAVRILRGYRERIERLEQTERGGTRPVQQTREVRAAVVISDSVSATTGDAGGFTWGVSNWGTDEFAGTL